MRKKILTIDIETGEEKDGLVKLDFSNNVISIGIYDGSDFRCFDTFNGVVSYFESLAKTTNYFVYAHNGGKFDYKYLFRYLDNYSLCLNGGQFICARWKNIEFRDSLNLFKSSLKKASKAFGGGTEKDEFPIGVWSDKRRMLHYLFMDCKSLYDSLSGFASVIDTIPEKLKLTVASTSYNEFRTSYGKNRFRIDFPSLHRSLYEKMIPAYFGGRVEIFRTELRQGFGIDVNSLYPSVLSSMRYPVGYPFDVTKRSEDLLGIYQVEISGYNDQSGIGQFPLRHDGKLLFPMGTFTTWITNADIDYFDERVSKRLAVGTIKILYGFEFVYGHPFASYIERLMHLKKQGGKDSGQYMMAKYLMNSLYGKFAQKPIQEDIQIVKDTSELNNYLGEGYAIVDDFSGVYWLSKESVQDKTKYFPVAVFCTAYARLVLLESLHFFADRGFSVAYCDTDSIFIGIEAEKDLCDVPGGLHPTRLGAWDREIDFHSGEFFLPKTYALYNEAGETIKLRAKGFPLRAIDGVQSIFDGCEWKGVAGLKTALRGGDIIRSMTKKIRAVYDKREILPDGNTAPIYF